MSRLPALVLSALLLLPLWGHATESLLVFTSVVPLKTFVERVGGGRVEVQAMVQPGQSPATYDPTPRQVAALARADLYVRVGVPFETAWMKRILSANSGMPVLDARDGIDLRRHDGGDDDHGHEALDPHVWTSPPLVKVMAANIRDALIRLDPVHRADYETGYRTFAAELDALDGEIRGLLADVSRRRFLVYHPAWGYFADTYGLTQVAIEREGKEPGARALAALIDQARREGVRVIFVQPQFNRRSAEQVARAIGGRVEAIDPLAADYEDNLRRVAQAIAEAGRP
jgi:zinc transport system substrate-binding protein